MKAASEKEWTLLIYANGNNELEPEMSKVFQELIENSCGCDFNIVIEIGRIDRNIARILREDESFEYDGSGWTGVRRYEIQERRALLVENFGNINMASPKEVYNFARWAMERYPARHYLFTMGGHGSSFIGMMTDLSQSMPFGLPTMEACMAINHIISDTGKSIDILLLDICYMNTIEVMYELGKSSRNSVKNVITYIGEGPMNGISYAVLLDVLRNKMKEQNVDIIAKAIIKNMGLSLAAVKIDHGKLMKIKKAANDAAYLYLKYCRDNQLKVNPYEIQNICFKDEEWTRYIKKLDKYMKSLVMDSNNGSKEGKKVIEIVCSEIGELAPAYFRMSFAKNNYWSYLISGLPLEKNLLNAQVEVSLEPKVLSFNSLFRLILVSTGFDMEKSRSIFEKLISYRGWHI